MISLETPPPRAPAPVPCVGRGGLLRVTFAFLQNPAEPGTASRGNGSPRPWKKLFCRITHTHTTGICPLPGLAPNPFPQPLTGSSGASGGPVWFLQAPSSRSLLREPPRGPCPGTSGCFCWGGAVASGHGGAAGGGPRGWQSLAGDDAHQLCRHFFLLGFPTRTHGTALFWQAQLCFHRHPL